MNSEKNIWQQKPPGGYVFELSRRKLVLVKLIAKIFSQYDAQTQIFRVKVTGGYNFRGRIHELSKSYCVDFEIHAETHSKLTFCLLEHDSANAKQSLFFSKHEFPFFSSWGHVAIGFCGVL